MRRRLERGEVMAIRRLYAALFEYDEIAEAMNASRHTVSNVVNMRTHKQPVRGLSNGACGWRSREE